MEVRKTLLPKLLDQSKIEPIQPHHQRPRRHPQTLARATDTGTATVAGTDTVADTVTHRLQSLPKIPGGRGTSNTPSTVGATS